MRGTLEQRFWAKVEIAGPDECWLWQAYKIPNGYGRIWRGRGILMAHRVSYELHYGPIPDGMCVCHHCDNPGCVNPAHLFVGSQAENIHDCIDKGRHRPPKGEACNFAKLTQVQVGEIRKLYATGNYSQKDLGRKYGVSRAQISRIVRRKRWK